MKKSSKRRNDKLRPCLTKKRFKMVTNPSSRLKVAKQILGYSFCNPKLLEEALTHSSFSVSTGAKSNYKRLEFVGDVALNLGLTRHFYSTCPNLGPSQLDKLRAANLCNDNLARVSVQHGLYRLILHKSPVLDKQVQEFTKAITQDPKNGSATNKAPKVLADVVEAIAAAIYEDSNFNLDVMWKVLRRLLKPLITVNTLNLNKKPVTHLNKRCQKSGKTVESCTEQKRRPTISNVGKNVGCKSSKKKTTGTLNEAKDEKKAKQKLNN